MLKISTGKRSKHLGMPRFVQICARFELIVYPDTPLNFANILQSFMVRCLIAFKNEIFSKLRYDEIDYDTYTAFPPTRPTGNIAQCLALKFHGHDEGIVVGNTHLYWRPESFYERLRQGSIYIQSSYENLLSVKGMHSNVKWNYVLAGDLNTTPTDPTYPSLTRNSLTPIQEAWLEWSRREFDEEEVVVEDILDTAMPPPKPSEADDTHLATASELRKLIHDTLPLKSVYTDYSAVDKDDTQLYGEPKYTHYGTYFKGTLDYIFIPPHGDIVCRELLPIPKANEMEPGLPNPLFGSDHVPLLCSLHILDKTKQ
ncbi:RNA exonuclease ngl2 [Umbelopsis nana]